MIKALMEAAGVPVLDEEYSKEIEKARQHLRALIYTKQCARIMLRLAWHDAGTYDAKAKTGSPNGSIRNKEEYMNASNTGLKLAIDLCEEVKAKHPSVTYADLYQLAGVVAVEVRGGPTIDFRPGRKDSNESPNDGLKQGPTNLRGVFHKMGLSDKDMVALSGGKANLDEKPLTNAPSTFDNFYLKKLLQRLNDGLVSLPIEKALLKHPKSRTYVQLYAKDKEAFFKDYAESHKKLSQLGFSPIPISQDAASMLGGLVGLIVAVAVVLSSYIIIFINHQLCPCRQY